jgi:hypothetical protein
MSRRKGKGAAAAPEHGLYYKTPVTPEEVFQAIGRLRKQARDEIHRLILFLDDTDNHMELEDSIDDNPHDGDELEPSLCGVTVAAANMPNVRTDADRELEEGNDEPSLGTLEASIDVYPDHGHVMTRNFDQNAKQGGSLDLEDQHDGREPDLDDEPSLCGVSVESFQMYGDQDLEVDGNDEPDREAGPAFPEGVMDQTIMPPLGAGDGIGGVQGCRERANVSPNISARQSARWNRSAGTFGYTSRWSGARPGTINAPS